VGGIIHHLDSLPPDVRQRVEDELDPGERVTWAEQPDPKRYARGSWAIVLFGIPWTAFAVFWMVMASGMLWMGGNAGDGPPAAFSVCFPLFGVPFVLIGLGMLSAPYWARRFAAGTVYAITDRRAILFATGFRSRTVKSYRPAELTRISRVERADGSGDLILEEYGYRDRDGDRRSGTHGFKGVANVKEVERLVRALAAKAGSANGAT
jgi:hypothetical protein